jgi:hypothetical protein
VTAPFVCDGTKVNVPLPTGLDVSWMGSSGSSRKIVGMLIEVGTSMRNLISTKLTDMLIEPIDELLRSILTSTVAVPLQGGLPTGVTLT